MTDTGRHVVVVGGGTAGWLTACILAAVRRSVGDSETRVTLIESPDIATIGVGEGTWPSMRATLQRIGMSEAEFLRCADASFKQGTRFVGWTAKNDPDVYDHPFSFPADYAAVNLAPFWLAQQTAQSFSSFVSPQSDLIDRSLAPKRVDTPEYAFAVNYAYHLDAGRFASLLCTHGVERLHVRHVRANVTRVQGREDGDIDRLNLDNGETISADLFVDCTGQRGLLIDGHCGVPYVPAHDVLFNDSAIAVQIPHKEADAAVASATTSTATSIGWIWDIALPSRRGLGHVFSSRHGTAEEARAILRNYARVDAALADELVGDDQYRQLQFHPGYRERFWANNCVAVGMSAGFIEPLEASAIALIEQSATIVAQNLPHDRTIMDAVARRFNEKLGYHWKRIIEFLKLHYVLSHREEPYWRDHRDRKTWPASLDDKMTLWRQQSPYHADAPMLDELFPSASYQYVLYGSGFRPDLPVRVNAAERLRAEKALARAREMRETLLQTLPTNRGLLDAWSNRASLGEQCA